MKKIESFLKQSDLYPALVLESYFSAKKRRLLIQITKYLLLAIPIIIILNILFNDYGLSGPDGTIDFLVRKLLGLALISFSVYVLMHMFEAYFASIYYFEYIEKNRYNKNETYTFSAGRILKKVVNDNVLTGFLRSQGVGEKILQRLGISQSEINSLLMKQAEIKNPPSFNLQNQKILKVWDLTKFIYDNFPDFRKLLDNKEVNQKELEATVDWAVYQIENDEYNRQWWRSDRLSRIPGVASDWSFGKTYLLSKFSRNLLNDEEVNSEAISFSGRTRELDQLQTILSRPGQANALLVGVSSQEKMEVVWNLVKKIINKKVVPQLLNHKPLLFFATDFTKTIQSGKDFQEKLTEIFSEALRAGNIILVIDNLPHLMIQAKQYNLDLYEIIEPYLAGLGGEIIALAETEHFHNLIEKDKALMSRFETIMIKPLSLEEIIKIIAMKAVVAEKIYKLIYTYQAILEIAKSADYYFPNGISSDKAEDLLAEISPWAIERDLVVIDKEAVMEYVGQKTNIPTTRPSEAEKDKLINLENLLMKRVVAQREAVFAVANALRRSRAGIRNENRPLGSFLFLGPTGVGKTETAKALADVFFGLPGQGDEKLLLRLDMSEYQGVNALDRLMENLSNMLRENPYGVLLLDEFEKTNQSVLNVFLQIIDEGYFSDTAGRKVMARNILFIATSNAGAEKIFEVLSNRKDLKNYETEIISDIIKGGIFKPELINRFDATILFHPLTKENLSEIAKLMLEKVAKRLAERGITLNIDKDLISFVVNGGYNPTFGARPMNRFIQDTIEQHLADLIIRDQISIGQTISFKVLDNKNTRSSLKPVIV